MIIGRFNNHTLKAGREATRTLFVEDADTGLIGLSLLVENHPTHSETLRQISKFALYICSNYQIALSTDEALQLLGLCLSEVLEEEGLV